ncbi:MAG: hypothetical protein AAF830_13815 [Pseudomonadota bacterium]
MTKTTYVVTAPDGTHHTRTTHRTYTHAVLLEDDGGWNTVGFCGRPDLADKKRGEHPGSIVVECGVLGDPSSDMPEAQATDKASHTPSKQPKPTIGFLVQELLMNEGLDYAAIVDAVVVEFPNVKTTVRSVASVAAVLRKKGLDVPMRRKSRD